MCKIFEFLLLPYPSDFYKTSTLCFSRLSNFFKNMSSRILEKSFSDKFIQIIDMHRQGKSTEMFLKICFPIIGIILNLHKFESNEIFKKLFIDSDLDIQPLLNVINYIKPENRNKPQIIKYKTLLENYHSMKDKHYTKTMSDKEWYELESNEKICIICYSKEVNTVLLPCGHSIYILILESCDECIRQYLTDKSHCFICNANIEKTKTI